ncbi:MAG: LPXTG cell wall anchor domain-containing protein [Bacilli bacterium]
MLPSTGYINYIWMFIIILLVLLAVRIIYVIFKNKSLKK